MQSTNQFQLEKVATNAERKRAKENPKATQLSKYWPKIAPHQVTSLDRSVEKHYQTYKQRFDTGKTTNTYTCREKTARAKSSRNVGDTCDHVKTQHRQPVWGKVIWPRHLADRQRLGGKWNRSCAIVWAGDREAFAWASHAQLQDPAKVKHTGPD